MRKETRDLLATGAIFIFTWSLTTRPTIGFLIAGISYYILYRIREKTSEKEINK